MDADLSPKSRHAQDKTTSSSQTVPRTAWRKSSWSNLNEQKQVQLVKGWWLLHKCHTSPLLRTGWGPTSEKVQFCGWLVKKYYPSPLPRTGWRPTGERVQCSGWLVKKFWRSPPPEQGEESPVCEKTCVLVLWWRALLVHPQSRVKKVSKDHCSAALVKRHG